MPFLTLLYFIYTYTNAHMGDKTPITHGGEASTKHEAQHEKNTKHDQDRLTHQPREAKTPSDNPSQPTGLVPIGNDKPYVQTMEERRALEEHITKHQSSHVIRFLIYMTMRNMLTETKRRYIYKELMDALPPSSIGASVVDVNGIRYYVVFKPCNKDHDMGAQLNIVPLNGRSKLTYMLGFVLYAIRKDYAIFLNDYEYMKDLMIEDLPSGKKDITIKVDMENTTLYIHQDDELRMGIYVEREDMISQINTGEMASEMLHHITLDGFEPVMIEYLTRRSIEWQLYITLMSNLSIEKDYLKTQYKDTHI